AFTWSDLFALPRIRIGNSVIGTTWKGRMAQEHIARLFLKHQDLLRAYIRGLLRDPHAADDLFQEVGVRVLSHAHSPEDPGEFVPWCRGIARNMLLHHWRSERRN